MKTLVCVSITSKTLQGALRDIRLSKGADIIEIRLDFIKGVTDAVVRTLIKGSTKPIIATCRPTAFGGNFKGPESKRIQLLEAAARDASYIDVEFGSVAARHFLGRPKSKLNAKIILSHHDFKGTPSLPDLQSMYGRMMKERPDHIKIVTYASSILDNFKMFDLLKWKKGLIGLCMGEKGKISRILAPKFGSFLTFASVSDGRESAPGQLALAEILWLYQVKRITPRTKVFGIIAQDASKSLSPHMHNPLFGKKGIDAVYLPFSVSSNELKDFTKEFRRFGFMGASITIPHKESIIPFLDGLDSIPKRIGAVNTVVNKRGKLVGYNTDAYGIMQALRENTQIKGKKILVLGAGGAARAAVFSLSQEGALIAIANRTVSKAKALAQEFNGGWIETSHLKESIGGYDIIINTTSVGMAPDHQRTPLPLIEMPKGKVVMDIIYKPRNTLLIKTARSRGCRTITGDRMLLHQAVKQFILWTGISPQISLMEKKLEAHTKE